MRFECSRRNAALFTGLAVNWLLLINLLFKPSRKTDPATRILDSGYSDGYNAVAAVVVVIALVSVLFFNRSNAAEKIGGLILATIAPILMVAFIFVFKA